MTTPLFLLRCVQLGLSICDLDLLSIGLINAVAGSSEEAHKYALKAMKYLQRDALITVSDLENCE